MQTQDECRCCKEIAEVGVVMDEFPHVSCITEHPGFQNVCQDVHVLRTAYHAYRQQYQEIEETNE